MMPVRNPFDRIKVMPSGCREWQGALTKHGYGQVTFRGKTWSVHRLVWTMLCGEIPPTLGVLHKCDNRKCCHHEHLFLGTQLDNAKDRDAKGRNGGRTLSAKFTHCKHGHKFTPENTYIYKHRNGRWVMRQCRTCNRANGKRYKASKK